MTKKQSSFTATLGFFHSLTYDSVQISQNGGQHMLRRGTGKTKLDTYCYILNNNWY